ncbi:MAG: MBL fold metallo-hydrolase, partial [Verrucomicrobiota bacterium]|nr:MBL fold metallo-hydrolase [Verrucomicrobiota bacterium]
MKFTNLTRQTEIGANCYCLESGAERFVLDSGMHPKEDGDAALPLFDSLGGNEIDAIIISHAHQDHIGTLPVLMRRQPTARVFMTEATAAIGDALLHNSVNVMRRQEPGMLLFTHKEANRAADLWRACRFRQPM